jgi:hypothetical protein
VIEPFPTGRDAVLQHNAAQIAVREPALSAA